LPDNSIELDNIYVTLEGVSYIVNLNKQMSTIYN
jgi:hypothetical protein